MEKICLKYRAYLRAFIYNVFKANKPHILIMVMVSSKRWFCFFDICYQLFENNSPGQSDWWIRFPCSVISSTTSINSHNLKLSVIFFLSKTIFLVLNINFSLDSEHYFLMFYNLFCLLQNHTILTNKWIYF